jgi:MarR family 2-MHQ and catechol resistance regulon transcriptional repressor
MNEAVKLEGLAKHLLEMRDAFRHHQNEIRGKYKISANEMEIILFISQEGPQRMKSIGEKFKIKFSTLTSLVDKIERLNLVRRVNSKEDRRSILVNLTKKGKRMLEEYNQQVIDLSDKFNKASAGKNLVDLFEKAGPFNGE